MIRINQLYPSSISKQRRLKYSLLAVEKISSNANFMLGFIRKTTESIPVASGKDVASGKRLLSSRSIRLHAQVTYMRDRYKSEFRFDYANRCGCEDETLIRLFPVWFYNSPQSFNFICSSCASCLPTLPPPSQNCIVPTTFIKYDSPSCTPDI